MCVGFCRTTVSAQRDPGKGKDNMNKTELIEAVAKEADTTKAEAERVIDAFFHSVKASMRMGDKVAWPGFGSFSTTQRPARVGRNPQTGAAMTIAATTAMKFTASSALKAELNQK